MKKYLLNINRAVIHSGESPCNPAKRMKEANKKWFDDYEEAVNFYEDENKKGQPCTLCLKEKILKNV